MNNFSKKISILIADDHVTARNGLRNILEVQENDTFLVSEVTNGAEAIDQIMKHDFDLVLLDLQMPKLDGFGALESIREKGNHTKIIIFSFHNNELLIQRANLSGANGFLSKGVSEEELLFGIKTVLDGQCYFGKVSKDCTIKDPKDNLTNRELQILELIANEKTNADIGEHLGISIRTVEGHKRNLTDKLLVKGSVGLTKYALKHGVIKNI